MMAFRESPVEKAGTEPKTRSMVVLAEKNLETSDPFSLEKFLGARKKNMFCE